MWLDFEMMKYFKMLTPMTKVAYDSFVLYSSKSLGDTNAACDLGVDPRSSGERI